MGGDWYYVNPPENKSCTDCYLHFAGYSDLNNNSIHSESRNRGVIMA